ncbi:hypothetical protein PQX77_011310 [Marasmius sp. AFHP31]|nr:hypothetical protein PQX77_011310 [Marasmius sp. AFHP31]
MHLIRPATNEKVRSCEPFFKDSVTEVLFLSHEISKALHDADVKNRSESARWIEEEKASQNVFKDEAATIPSPQKASPTISIRDPEPSRKAKRWGSEALLGSVPTTIRVSDSDRGISLEKRKRVSSRSPTSKDDCISVPIPVDSEKWWIGLRRGDELAPPRSSLHLRSSSSLELTLGHG